jgi:hypothetical protein
MLLHALQLAHRFQLQADTAPLLGVFVLLVLFCDAHRIDPYQPICELYLMA